MKTNLERKIETSEEAMEFLRELCDNGEAYHPEDDAHDIVWHRDTIEPTVEQCDALNALMAQIYKNTDLDPCGYIIENF